MRGTCLTVPIMLSLAALTACGRTKDRADTGTSGVGGIGGAGSLGSGGTAAKGGGAAGAATGTGGSDAGVGGSAGAAWGADCADLSRAPTGRYDFRVVGSGFDAYDGETVRAVVVYVNHTGYGLSETTVRNGSFEIALPKTNEPYTGYGVYIDRGTDDACTVEVDPFFQMVSGGIFQDVNWEINPQTHFLAGLPPCNIDGIFDLTQPLRCPGPTGTAGFGGTSGSGAGGAIGAGGTTGGGVATAGSDGAGTRDDAGLRDAGDAARMLEPIQIVEGKIDGGSSYHNLRFVGSGLDQYEGDVVTFRIGAMTGSWRVGFGQARIVQGAFDVLFPEVVAPGYEQKQAYIDADGNGRCDAGEPLFMDSGLQNMDTTLTFTPSALQVRAAPAGSCDILNGWTAPQP